MRRSFAFIFVIALAACGNSHRVALEKPVTVPAVLAYVQPGSADAKSSLPTLPRGAVALPYTSNFDDLGVGRALITTHSVPVRYWRQYPGDRYKTVLAPHPNNPFFTHCQEGTFLGCYVPIGTMELTNQGTETVAGSQVPAFDCVFTPNAVGAVLRFTTPHTYDSQGGWIHTGDATGEHSFTFGQKYRCLFRYADNGSVAFP